MNMNMNMNMKKSIFIKKRKYILYKYTKKGDAQEMGFRAGRSEGGKPISG